MFVLNKAVGWASLCGQKVRRGGALPAGKDFRWKPLGRCLELEQVGSLGL